MMQMAGPAEVDQLDPARIIAEATQQSLTIATAESLTAGMIAATLADVPGASAVLRGGVVSYCNEVKQQLLGVSAQLLNTVGAVDPGVAAAMAEGALISCGADLAVSATGVAGPEAHQGKPVGTVYIGFAFRPQVTNWPQGLFTVGEDVTLSNAPVGTQESNVSSGAVLIRANGTRSEIRASTVAAAMGLLWLLMRQPAQTNKA